ncbi:PACE efflux transporter [Pseudomonas sp. UBA6310]|uniref:PACE efflux transporter n=1 Tax=Pseudomonas sp. UBA6310 TaxID=1947327 RepID=UPI00257FC578|nr:PACE efflux transporter [Pseudomonas sp. UBA6310]
MQGTKRKVVQALLYELCAMGFVSPAIAFAFDRSMSYSGILAVMLSSIAMSWNMLFNALFERWEARQPSRERTLRRRLLHSLGFEGGLTLLLVPVMAWWLEISLVAALFTDIGLLAFFFAYAFVFQWCFDRLFGVPDSARDVPECA